MKKAWVVFGVILVVGGIMKYIDHRYPNGPNGPSYADIERGVQARVSRSATRYSAATHRAAPEVDIRVQVTGCSPYAQDYLCGVQAQFSAEGRSIDRDLTLRMTKQGDNWVEVPE